MSPLPGQQVQKLRMFSIMAERVGHKLQPIPFIVLQPYEHRARINHLQSLDRLNERGGLHPKEALCILYDQPAYGKWYDENIARISFEEAERKLRLVVAQRLELLKNVPPAPCTHPPRPEKLDDRGLTKCPQCGELTNGI